MCIFDKKEAMMISESLLKLKEPRDYFRGKGYRTSLPAPSNILVFIRRDRKTLQQGAIENRSHHRWVLICNLGTSGRVHVDHRTHHFTPGEFLLVEPFRFHHFSGLETEKLAWLFCTFELDPDPILRALSQQAVRADSRARDALQQVLTVWGKLEASAKTSLLGGMQMQTAVLELLLELSETAEALEGPDHAPERPGHLLESINQILRGYGNEIPTITALAVSLSMSPSGLRAKFREIAGVSLGTYLKNYRIRKAMALLRTTGESIGGIATELGYSSTPAFCRAFHAVVEMTPLAYRNFR